MPRKGIYKTINGKKVFFHVDRYDQPRDISEYYQCHGCSRKFLSRSAYKNHLWKVHKQSW